MTEPDHTQAKRQRQARRLGESPEWNAVLLPEINRLITEAETALLTKKLSLEEAAAFREARGSLIHIRNYPALVAGGPPLVPRPDTDAEIEM